MISYTDFLERIQLLEKRITTACRQCDRAREEVTLMAVTKTHPPAAVAYAEQAGLCCIGENRVQEAVDKRAKRGNGQIRWELIGHLQSNKAKSAVTCFDRIQTVDSLRLLHRLEALAGTLRTTPLTILLQVNAGDDPAKHGIRCAEAPALLEAALRCEHLVVEGLMTIAPLNEDITIARQTFRRLRELRDQLSQTFAVPLAELSMGMTEDLEVAIEEGSTLIRIGTALYGKR